MLTLGSAPIGQTLAEGQATVLNLSSTPIGRLPEGFATARTGKGRPAEWEVIEELNGERRPTRTVTSTFVAETRSMVALELRNGADRYPVAQIAVDVQAASPIVPEKLD